MGKWSRQEATIHQNIAIDATHNTHTLRYPYPTNQTFKGGLEILFISWTHHHLDPSNAFNGRSEQKQREHPMHESCTGQRAGRTAEPIILGDDGNLEHREKLASTLHKPANNCRPNAFTELNTDIQFVQQPVFMANL